MCCGARHVVPASHGFDAAELFGLAEQMGDVSLFAAPTMVKRMVEQARRQDYHGAGIKTIVYGGGPMYLADLREAVDTFGPRLVQIYGQGESPMTISVLPRALIAERQRPDWLPWPPRWAMRKRVEIRILDAEHQPLPTGQRGEIAVRGATVMQATGATPGHAPDAGGRLAADW